MSPLTRVIGNTVKPTEIWGMKLKPSELKKQQNKAEWWRLRQSAVCAEKIKINKKGIFLFHAGCDEEPLTLPVRLHTSLHVCNDYVYIF